MTIVLPASKPRTARDLGDDRATKPGTQRNAQKPLCESGGDADKGIEEINDRMMSLTDNLSTERRTCVDPVRIPHELAMRIEQAGRLTGGENAFRLALSEDPNCIVALIGLAHCFEKQGRHVDADAVIGRLLALDTDDPPLAMDASLLLAAIDLIDLLRKHERFDQSDAVVEKIIAVDPDNDPLQYQFGMLLLQCGEFKHGWRQRDTRVTPFPRPVWEGERLDGKTILVQAMHGFGDTIQFVRLLPLVKERGARVILEHQPALSTLLLGAEGWDELVPKHTGQEVWDLDFDVHARLMSLPIPLELEGRIPARIPYLRPDPARVEHWRERLADDRGCKVGLVWGGNPNYQRNPIRSCRLEDYAWLARLPEVSFYSLQKGPAADQIASAPPRLGLIDLGPELHDFADTAAAIMNLDLVITVDTSVAHLSGALGRPTWTILPFHSCWRWLLGRDDTPWYPTMRLFRQISPGNWASVMRQVIGELDRFRLGRTAGRDNISS